MKKTTAVLLSLLFVFLCSCGKESEVGTTVAESIREQAPVTDFLTGKRLQQDEALPPRPVAVMVNNLEASLPQYGISDADIIMEMPVEGGITRLMAIYSDYRKVPSVCSVRSCRYYFPIFAKLFDAVYFCFGSNELLGTPMLEKSGVDYIDGNKTGDSLVFERDSRRLEFYAPEHTVYLKGENMTEIFEKYGFRKELSTSYGKSVFDFSDEKQKFLFECTGITGSFSSYYSSDFFFNEETETYFKNHNGEKHLDAKSLSQLDFTNVFLLKAEVSLYENTNLVEINLRGGKGYYATMGSVEEISWRVKGEASSLELFDSSGNPLKVNKGKSYIGIGVENVIMSRDTSVQE